MSLLCSRGYEVGTDNSFVPPVVTPERSPGLPTTMDVDVPPVMPPPIPPTSVDAVEGGPVGVVAGDGATRVEITPEMFDAWKSSYPEVHPLAWELLNQMSPVEAFQLVTAIAFNHQMMEQQAQAKPTVDTPIDATGTPEPAPEPTPDPVPTVVDPRVMDVEQVRALLNDELAAEYEALTMDEERVNFLIANNLIENPIRHPNPDEVIILPDALVRQILQDDTLADQYAAMDEEGKRQFLHSLFIPLTEDDGRDTLLDPRTRELMRDLGSEVVAEKILLEHMARASKKFADAIDPEFEKANDKWLLKSLRWLFNISPEENIKTVGLQTLVDGLIFVGSTGLDYVTGKPLMDQLEKIGFLSALGIDRSRADAKAGHDTLEYKSHIKLRILGQVIDFVTDAMMEGGINKVYETLNRKEMKEMFGHLGYSEDEINKYMENWKNGSYVTPLAGVLGKLSTIFLPADIKNLISSANLSAGQRILRRFPVVGRYVFAPIVDFIDGRFKKWPILKGLIPTVGGVVGLARELR